MQRDDLMKNWNFLSKKANTKRWNIKLFNLMRWRLENYTNMMGG